MWRVVAAKMWLDFKLTKRFISYSSFVLCFNMPKLIFAGKIAIDAASQRNCSWAVQKAGGRNTDLTGLLQVKHFILQCMWYCLRNPCTWYCNCGWRNFSTKLDSEDLKHLIVFKLPRILFLTFYSYIWLTFKFIPLNSYNSLNSQLSKWGLVSCGICSSKCHF